MRQIEKFASHTARMICAYGVRENIKKRFLRSAPRQEEKKKKVARHVLVSCRAAIINSIVHRYERTTAEVVLQKYDTTAVLVQQ